MSENPDVRPEGFRKCEHFPTLLVHEECGSICDASGVIGHIKWHKDLLSHTERGN